MFADRIDKVANPDFFSGSNRPVLLRDTPIPLQSGKRHMQQCIVHTGPYWDKKSVRYRILFDKEDNAQVEIEEYTAIGRKKKYLPLVNNITYHGAVQIIFWHAVNRPQSISKAILFMCPSAQILSERVAA